MKRSRLILLFVVGLLAALGMFWGCDDECPTCPPRTVVSLNTIWPNADGTWWQYEYAWRVWDNDQILYENELDVPPAPSLDEMIALLGNQPIGPNVTTLDRNFQLAFAGLDTTLSGVIAQNLEETVYGGPMSEAPAPAIDGEARMLLHILQARPDLADKIVPMLQSAPVALPAPMTEYLAALTAKPSAYPRPKRTEFFDGPGPMLLHGGAWWKTRDWIGTYGDIDQVLAWKFLEKDLRIGHEFTHQLIPSLESDLFMHCRIIKKGTVVTPAGTFSNAVEAFYLIDYGVTDFDGLEMPMHARIIDYGSIAYVPNYGPVYSYERNLVYVGDDVLSPGFGDQTLRLLDSSLLED
ncbi:MAG: hypothetical protein HY770_05810 [Chitinivibrionia bacterium]|nr:hypothetical protein [Chitinivibrionia bacterium]